MKVDVTVDVGDVALNKKCAYCGSDFAPKARTALYCCGNCRKRAYDRRHAGTCVDCGSGLSYAKAQRCRPCEHARKTVWTRSRIIQKIQEYYSLYGEVPTGVDWGAAPYCASLTAERRNLAIARWEAGDWPWFVVVHQRFGSFGKAIEAAGFRHHGRGRRPNGWCSTVKQ